MRAPGDPVADTKEDDIIAHSAVGFLESRDWKKVLRVSMATWRTASDLVAICYSRVLIQEIKEADRLGEVNCS